MISSIAQIAELTTALIAERVVRYGGEEAPLQEGPTEPVNNFLIFKSLVTMWVMISVPEPFQCE